MKNIFKAIAICGLLIAPAATASFSSRMATVTNTMKHSATNKNFKIGTSIAALSAAAGFATYMLTKNNNYMALTKAAPIIIATSIFLGVLGVAIHKISAHTYKQITYLCGKKTAEQIELDKAIDQQVKEAMAQSAINAANQLLKDQERQDVLDQIIQEVENQNGIKAALEYYQEINTTPIID
jgi:hypothetical protein